MAESYSDTTVFDCQVKACKQFFQDELPRAEFNLVAGEDRPDNMKRFKGHIYDITGFDGQQVVAVLAAIVNSESSLPWTENKTFYLWIHDSNQGCTEGEWEELFRLNAKPALAKNQPGNGIVFLRPKGRKTFKRDDTGAKSYEGLNGTLEGVYYAKDDQGILIFPDTTAAFATHIKQLFENNAQNKGIPQATFEAYMILLFEIARRLVKSDNPTDTQVEYDVLPIGSAIARIVKLLKLRKCSFEDVFFTKHKFHCFSNGPVERREAIEEINKAILETTKKSTAPVGVYKKFLSYLLPPLSLLSTPSTQANAEQNTTKEHLKELQEMFCSEARLAKMSFIEEEEELAAEFKNLATRISSQRRSWSVTESTTAFDHRE